MIQKDFLNRIKNQLGVTWDELAKLSGINPRAMKSYRMPSDSRGYRPMPETARNMLEQLVQGRDLISQANIRGFYKTSTMLYEEKLRAKRPFDPTYVAPYVVNTVFVCELCLKLLITRGGDSFIKTHDIMKLLNQLSALPYFSNIKDSMYQKIQDAHDDKDTNWCEENLILIDKAFIKWRYLNDPNKFSIHINFVKIMTEFLVNECLDD